MDIVEEPNLVDNKVINKIIKAQNKLDLINQSQPQPSNNILDFFINNLLIFFILLLIALFLCYRYNDVKHNSNIRFKNKKKTNNNNNGY